MAAARWVQGQARVGGDGRRKRFQRSGAEPARGRRRLREQTRGPPARRGLAPATPRPVGRARRRWETACEAPPTPRPHGSRPPDRPRPRPAVAPREQDARCATAVGGGRPADATEELVQRPEQLARASRRRLLGSDDSELGLDTRAEREQRRGVEQLGRTGGPLESLLNQRPRTLVLPAQQRELRPQGVHLARELGGLPLGEQACRRLHRPLGLDAGPAAQREVRRDEVAHQRVPLHRRAFRNRLEGELPPRPTHRAGTSPEPS